MARKILQFRSHALHEPAAKLHVSGAPTRSPSLSTFRSRPVSKCRRAGVRWRGVVTSNASDFAVHSEMHSRRTPSYIGNTMAVMGVDGRDAVLTRRPVGHVGASASAMRAASESMIVRGSC